MLYLPEPVVKEKTIRSKHAHLDTKSETLLYRFNFAKKKGSAIFGVYLMAGCAKFLMKSMFSRNI